MRWRAGARLSFFAGLTVLGDRAYTVASGTPSDLVVVRPDGRASSMLTFSGEHLRLSVCDHTAGGELIVCGSFSGELRVGAQVLHRSATPSTGVVLWVSPDGAVLRVHLAGRAVSKARALANGGVVVVAHPRRTGADELGDLDGTTLQLLDRAGRVTRELAWPMQSFSIFATAVTADGSIVVGGAAVERGTIGGRAVSEDRGVAGFVVHVTPEGDIAHLLAPRGGRIRIHAIAQTGSDLYLVGRFRGRVRLGDTWLQSSDQDDDALVWVVDATSFEHRWAVRCGGPGPDQFLTAVVMPSGHVRALGGFRETADSLLPDAERGPHVLDVEFSRDGKTLRTRRRYLTDPAFVGTSVSDAALWGTRLALVGTTDGRAPFLPRSPGEALESLTSFLAITP